MIEEYHKKTGLRYIDCIIDVFEEYNIDPYEAKLCLTDETVNKLRIDALKHNQLPGDKQTESDITQLF